MSEHGMNEIRVLLDTDANNEIDDQHAIAYLLLSGDSFILEGITVNKTNNGGDIHEQAKEAERVIKLCDMEDKISVTLGASDSFSEIQSKVMNPVFDGSDAVDLMIEKAHRNASQVLTILAIGKLTNIALAIKKDPTIVSKIKVVWLGSNYPLPGEYNLESDSESMNFVIASGVLFEIAVVRYKEKSGTTAVTVTPQDLERNIVGNGPKLDKAVIGRNGGEFFNFGDYSFNLLDNVYLFGDPPSRPLYDMAAVAVIKNPEWAEKKEIPSMLYKDGAWHAEPDLVTNLYIYEDFDKEKILEDFFSSVKNYIKVAVS
jgi:inosine-uridine nucleoside N-ribohydrolase